MIYQDRHPPYFLCLCSTEQQKLLAATAALSPHPLVFVDNVQAVVARGLEHPPLALILEIGTAIRFGPERMSRFLNLGVNWPVMRCAISPDGQARVMCFEPVHGEPLITALEGIATNDPSWQHPRFRRKYLRFKIPGRARVRMLGQDEWQRGNVVDVSCGGCFIALPSEHFQPHVPVELELRDFVESTFHLRGAIAWLRSWEDSLEVPGVGIEFDPATVSDEFRTFLAHCPQASELLAARA
jgi:hypothetical protein